MKKVLIITYYWPPSGGPGVQRWLKFVKYLPDFNIQPVVFIPENPSYPITDSSLLNEVPAHVRVVKHKIFEPYRLAKILSKKDTRTISSGIIADQKKQSFLQKLLLYIRGNFFIPDARKFWVKPAVNYLRDYLQKEHIQTVITTGPPHSVHLIGLALKKQAGVRWIADFRDPWTGIGYHEQLKLTRSSQKKHQKLEKQVLTGADWLLTTSFQTQKDFQKITSRPVSVITNGFDDEKTEQQTTPDEKFTLSHIGNLLQGRNPVNLWKVIGELTTENKAFRNSFRLRLTGKINTEVLADLKACGLTDFTDFTGYVTHERAVAYQQQSQVLLLIEVNSTKTRGIIPGKLFEYLRARRPILAVGPENWDVESIVSQTQSGCCFLYSDKEKIKAQLLQWFADYQEGTLGIRPQQIEQYHRKNLTASLAEIING